MCAFRLRRARTIVSGVFQHFSVTTEPASPADEYEKQAFITKVTAHIVDERQLQVDVKALWSVVWGQYSPTLVSKLLHEQDIWIEREMVMLNSFYMQSSQFV